MIENENKKRTNNLMNDSNKMDDKNIINCEKEEWKERKKN